MKRILRSTLLLSFACMGLILQAQTYNMTNTVVTTCSGIFYDDGGSSLNYGNSMNLTQTFTAPTPDYRIRVTFNTFDTEANYDSLSVYDGTTTAVSNFMGKYTGTFTPPTQYSTKESITFHFVSDAATNATGWDATISCFGLTGATPTSASQSKTVVLTINGSNTEFGLAPYPNNIILKHSVTTNSFSTAAITVISNTQLTATISIPCGADLGLYDLYVEQPGFGFTRLASAFTVTDYMINLTTSPPTCFGMSNGAITANVTGGTSPYTYYWQPGSMTTQVVSGLSAGSYTCNVTDGMGCIRTQVGILSQPPAINATGATTNVSCWGLNNGAISLTTTGGTPPYVYNWLPNGETTANISNLIDGVYTCNIQDANGCGASYSFAITQPSALTSSVATQSNPTCFGYTNGSAVVGASGGTSPFSYNWIPSGGTSPTATGIGAGNYSCTVTDANGCVSVTNVTLNQPTAITVNAGADVAICSGTATSLTSVTNGGSPGYTFNWAPSIGLGTPNTFNTTANPFSTTNYTLTATDANGCNGSDNVMVTVNALPPITISASANNICAGLSTTLTANAPTATGIVWNNSATSSSIVDAPLTNSFYWAMATDFNGCQDSASITIFATPRKNISGNIVNETNGTAVLYKHSAMLTQWDSITSVPISSSFYAFTSVDSADYVIKVIPGTSTNQVTYGNSFISWQDATIINHGCTNQSVQTITVIPLANIGTGTGSMSGTISEALGFGQRPDGSSFKPTAPGNPIGGIVVKGGRNPGGQMFTQTITDASGNYTLTNIPDGQNYFILVDIAGLDTNLTYHRDLMPGNNQLTGLDFTVDSMHINPINNSVGVNDMNAIEHQLVIYPNPSSQFININYQLKNEAIVNIELIDIVGKTTKTLLNKANQPADKYKQQFSVSDLNSGVYFIRLKIDQNESIIKLIITN